jgi:hypothetical protein
MNYQPELDVLNELVLELSSRYLQLIGIAQWAIELGRIDIHHEVSLLSQYQANPKGRTFGSFVSCVCIYEKSFGYRLCCI